MDDKKSVAKLFVGNLTYKVTAEDLNSVFRAYGEIVDMKIIDKGRHVYAFVEFSSIGDAEEAFRELQNKEVRGSVLKIEYAQGPRNKTQNRDNNRSSNAGGESKDRQECYQCGSTRHFKRDCPELRRGGGGSRSRSKDKFKNKKKKSHRRRSSSSRSSSSSKDKRRTKKKHTNRSGSPSKSNS